MSGSGHVLEMILYSLLNFTPYIAIALYPFRNSLRFSKQITTLLIVAAAILQVFIGLWAGMWGGNASMLSALSTIMYALFYFLAIRTDFGKALFTLLMLSNIANFITACSKCIEGIYFPTLAIQGYRWSFSLIMLLLELLLLIPLTVYMGRTYSTALEQDTAKPTWHFIWLIPATFYVEWYYRLYGSSESALAFAMDPSNTIFLLIINLGALLIYHMVICHIRVIDTNVRLSEQNHALITQQLQYENLKERIDQARQAKHDMRHHVLLLQSLLEDQKYAEAKQYLEAYKLTMPDDRSFRFCDHYAVNALLLYFAQQAKNQETDFEAAVQVPEDLNIPDNVLSVLLGNLLENALEASRHVETGKRKITIKSVCSGGMILFKISNTYAGTLLPNKNGLYLSTKHTGSGIGLASVRSIVEQNQGRMEITHTDTQFIVTVMLEQYRTKIMR